MSRRFDVVAAVDWSAAGAPSPIRPSADAIWIATARDGEAASPLYFRTRAEALDRLTALLAAERAAGRRVLAGFDFPFGWPRGFAEAVAGTPDALALWTRLAAEIEDGPRNRNNRFAVAERLNRLLPGRGPFWGRPRGLDHPDLPEKGSARGGHGLPERRHAEARVPRAQPCWKLYTTGSVGSQALLGVAALERLRRAPALAGATAVWPFETGFSAGGAPITLAEVYPSLLAGALRIGEGEVKDAAQVRTVAATLSRLDAEGALAPLFAGPADLDGAARETARREEGWILGAGAEPALLAAARGLPDPR